MPKRPVIFQPGMYYHLYHRGMGGQAAFREEADYLAFLRLFKQTADASQVAVIAYSLLPDHYHCLLRQDGETPVGQALRRVEDEYAADGVAFESSGRAMRVATESDFLTLCRYIHRNPLHHGLVAAPGDWPYSNYLEWIERRRGTLVTCDLVRAYFPTPQAYQTLAALPEPPGFQEGLRQAGMETP
ncbi:MAG TPA: hypothetical protein PKH77_12120 [Anaerolineae bacterium]|nr:hypothetical protein [Anaerolineae bacterium]